MNIDNKLNNVLDNYIDSEVERNTSIVVLSSLKSIGNDYGPYYEISSENNPMGHIFYNTVEIERFKNDLSSILQQEFSNVEKGDFSDYLLSQQQRLREKYPYFKNGYLCEVNVNSIQNSTLFGNLGPAIPIKLSFMGYVDSDVTIDVREYGINNVIVEVGVDVIITNMITMPISSRIKKTKVHEVLSVDVIKGEVPHYYVHSGV